MTGIIVRLGQLGIGSIRLDSGETCFFCASEVAHDSPRLFRALHISDVVTVDDIDRADPRGPKARGVRWFEDAAVLEPDEGNAIDTPHRSPEACLCRSCGVRLRVEELRDGERTRCDDCLERRRRQRAAVKRRLRA
jgi:hypothetical protein